MAMKVISNKTKTITKSVNADAPSFSRVIQIQNSGADAIDVLIESDAAWCTTKPKTVLVGPRQWSKVRVTCDGADLPAGRHECVVRFSVIGSSGDQSDAVRICMKVAKGHAAKPTARRGAKPKMPSRPIVLTDSLLDTIGDSPLVIMLGK